MPHGMPPQKITNLEISKYCTRWKSGDYKNKQTLLNYIYKAGTMDFCAALLKPSTVQSQSSILKN